MKYINNFLVVLGLLFAANAASTAQTIQKNATTASKYVGDTAKVDLVFQKKSKRDAISSIATVNPMND